MAKRYNRVNFQDSPSTATPLSATILNKLDKGIDDCDNAIEIINDNLATQLFSFTNNVSVDTIVVNTSYRIGKIVHVNLVLTLTGNVSEQTILTNFSGYTAKARSDMQIFSTSGFKGLAYVPESSSTIKTNTAVAAASGDFVFIIGTIILN